MNLSPTDIKTFKTFGPGGLVLMSRVIGWTGAPITPGTISSVLVEISDMNAGAAVVYSATPLVSDVVKDHLVKGTEDIRWKEDSVGYNVIFTVPGAAMPKVGHGYRIVMTFTPLSGDPFTVAAHNDVLNPRD